MRANLARVQLTVSPPKGLPLNGARLARELRHALDELGDAVEDGHDVVRTVEDAFAIEYPTAEGVRPPEAEQAQARKEMPEALMALAKVENQLRRQVWTLARARRRLARLSRRS
jgi:uncharacterized protein YukE